VVLQIFLCLAATAELHMTCSSQSAKGNAVTALLAQILRRVPATNSLIAAHSALRALPQTTATAQAVTGRTKLTACLIIEPFVNPDDDSCLRSRV
jgi:hypothetical protein